MLYLSSVFEVHGVETSEEPQPDAKPETLGAPTSFGPKPEAELHDRYYTMIRYNYIYVYVYLNTIYKTNPFKSILFLDLSWDLRPPEVPRERPAAPAPAAPAATTFGKQMTSGQNLLPEQEETVIGGEEKTSKTRTD